MRKTTHGLDGQHHDVDRTLCGRVNQSNRGQREMEKVCPWCGQPSDRGRLKNRTEHVSERFIVGSCPCPGQTGVLLLRLSSQAMLYCLIVMPEWMWPDGSVGVVM